MILEQKPGPAQHFRPDEAIGAALDGTTRGGVNRILTRSNVTAMKRAGLRPLSYRLRTELGIEAWHWNPRGSWSDPTHRQGYWTSSAELGKPIELSWGYRLPRRGDTGDQANNDDYSRLTDGNRATFWKSNPYLDPIALRDGMEHPQWLVVRFEKPHPIDTAVIDWGSPFARRYEVQYWLGANEDDSAGRWITFPNGRVIAGIGGTAQLTLADRPVTTTHVRVLLEHASALAPRGSTDWRDRAGFAVREVSFGLRRGDGSVEDAVVHAPSRTRQTFAHVSSTDPWHRAIDRDLDLEQAGIDRIFASGLGFDLPIMLPTGLLYDTPENVEAELRYIARRQVKVSRIELGEEPDGQYASAADYGALYLDMVDRLRGILPNATFGGPSLQSAFTDTWMQPEAPRSWDGWLARYLQQRHRLADFGFVSFEFYPFDDICGDISAKLIQESALLENAWSRLQQDGWPVGVPRIISEYGFSAYSGRAEAEMPSALLMGDIVGRWLSLGGSAAYLFGYPPNAPANQHLPCAGYGNMMLFLADRAGQARQPMPSFFASRLLTQAWAQPGHGRHDVLAAVFEGSNQGDVTAYPVRRPDGRISVLLVNRSSSRSHQIGLYSKLQSPTAARVFGPVTIFNYGPQQYTWIDKGEDSHPTRDRPPDEQHIATGPVTIELPPFTMAESGGSVP
ncbi:MAG: discoidin domain-containing protein [Novosphingobium sp.]|nr:discoidin domain-containing protein [Novosphingobium sp.]